MTVRAAVDLPWAPPGQAGSLRFGEPVAVVRADRLADVLPALARVVDACESGCHAVGFVSYEAAPAFDPAMRVRSGSGMPLVWFGLHRTPLPAHRPGGAGGSPAGDAAYLVSRWRPGTAADAYAASVAAVRAAIARGDTYQVNHTMRLRGRFAGDAYAAWRDLCAAQGHGWFGFVDTGAHRVLSASPELFFTWDGTDVVTRPMKGTRRRHPDPARDATLRDDLADSRKDRAENLMIVDLLRNDVARVCEPGSVSVPSLFDIESYPTVWQMTSTVRGRARAGVDLVDLLGALFPCGSITGAPKVRTMQLIADLEDRPRGVYCGAVGVVWPGGRAALNVAIRTLVVGRDGRARYDVGGGVVWDSRGTDEYAEALTKAAVLAPLAPESRQPGLRLIETMRAQGGRIVRLDRHLDRLAASAGWLGWPLDRRAVGEHLAAPAGGPARVRLTLGSQGDHDVTVGALPTGDPGPGGPGPRPVALAVAPVWSGDPFLRHKTTRRQVYEQALAAARQVHPEVEDVILLNERGEVTELTIGNLVVELDGGRWTPPLSCGLLPGTLRAELLDRGEVAERVLTVPDLRRASRLWLANSVRGLVRIALVGAG